MKECPFCHCVGTHEPLCLGSYTALSPEEDARLATPEEQRRQLARVRRGIAGIILAFCQERGPGYVFNAAELADYVKERNEGRAPASADRILRDLRSDGLIDYRATKGGVYTLVAPAALSAEGSR